MNGKGKNRGKIIYLLNYSFFILFIIKLFII